MQINKHGGHHDNKNTKVIHLLPSVPHPEIPVGGRLQHFKSEWFKLTKDPELIQMISGCHVKLCECPPSKQMPSVTMSSNQKMAAHQHIAELLQKKAIVKTKVTPGDFVCVQFS